MVGARKKWRDTTSQVTATVIGMMSQAVMIPVQSANHSIHSTVLRNPALTSSWPFPCGVVTLDPPVGRTGGAMGPEGGPIARRGSLEPDLVLVVVLGDELVLRPVGQPVRHHQTGVLFLRVDDLLVEVVLVGVVVL